MNLEDRLFYRLVKVMYVCFIIGFFGWMYQIFHEGWVLDVTVGGETHNFFPWLLQKEQLFQSLCMTIFFLLYYSILNIIKETLLYIAFGRKFKWDWIPCKRKLNKVIGILKFSRDADK